MIIKKYKHPVLFYILSTILPWTCWFIAGYISHITPGSNVLILASSGFAFLGLLAPNIVASILILPDRELRRDVLARFFNFKGVKIKYWLAACFFMLASKQYVMLLVPLNSAYCCLGISNDPITAMEQSLTEEDQPIDIGFLKGPKGDIEYWSNAVGIGFDAIVVIYTRKMQILKVLLFI